MTLIQHPLTAVLIGVVALMVMILRLRLPAFIALIISSILVGFLGGLSTEEVILAIKTGMGSTLGVVATLVGLGALFGGILELSGGAKSIAQFLLVKFGTRNSGFSLGLSGFIIAIPVFFDVAFIILIPVIYALQKNTGKSLLHFAIPLLSGLAVTHAFIPPTPGPIAVADILGANLGWVMLAGLISGSITLAISGIWLGKWLGNKIHISAPSSEGTLQEVDRLPSFYAMMAVICLPLVLIVLSTLIQEDFIPVSHEPMRHFFEFIGHPFMALILANLLAWYFLGIRRGFGSEKLLQVSAKSMQPAGIIILLTGAGSVFKQVLVDTDAGLLLAEKLADLGMPILLFAFLSAGIVRVLQGSATVAMITAAGLIAPFINAQEYSSMGLATMVIAIASGASLFSHVNDSGFWLVKEYLGMTEKQTLRSWTLMTGVLGCTGFICAALLHILF